MNTFQLDLFAGIDLSPHEMARDYLAGISGIGTPTINSISGGKTSAFMAIHYPADVTVFALVRTNHPSHQIVDPGLLRAIRGKCPDFVGSLELPDTLRCVLDLEQKIGREIIWVWGENFEDLVAAKGGYLPNRFSRYCTTEMKYIPIFDWFWNRYPGEICEMRLGFRADEPNRVFRMIGGKKVGSRWDFSQLGRCESHPRNRKKTEWRFRTAPLYLDGVKSHHIRQDPWVASQPFPEISNCTHCPFHTPREQRRQHELYPEKADFWIGLEDSTGNRFDKKMTLREILEGQGSTLWDDRRPCDCTD